MKPTICFLLVLGMANCAHIDTVNLSASQVWCSMCKCSMRVCASFNIQQPPLVLKWLPLAIVVAQGRIYVCHWKQLVLKCVILMADDICNKMIRYPLRMVVLWCKHHLECINTHCPLLIPAIIINDRNTTVTLKAADTAQICFLSYRPKGFCIWWLGNEESIKFNASDQMVCLDLLKIKEVWSHHCCDGSCFKFLFLLKEWLFWWNLQKHKIGHWWELFFSLFHFWVMGQAD